MENIIIREKGLRVRGGKSKISHKKLGRMIILIPMVRLPKKDTRFSDLPNTELKGILTYFFAHLFALLVQMCLYIELHIGRKIF